jgi:DnaJ-domain-containing protein 1
MDVEWREQLLAILEDHPEGISEHDLLKRLQATAGDDFPDTLFRDELALFRAHFLLFHALHRLRRQLLSGRRGVLQVEATCIRLGPYREASGAGLAEHDPMADYYLDLQNLHETSAAELDEMLGAFWARFHARSRRGEALAILGLEPTAELTEAQRRFRELAMQHHPDRGGDDERFREIQEAIAILRRC